MSSSNPVRPPAAVGAPEGDVSLSKGASIGRYIILGLLGRGGMGEVYAAYDPELNRKIAIKLLRARGDAATAGGRTRLLREAQAIARLSHPNVVVVYDVGTFQDTVFIAMEFVEGHTLGYWLQAQQRTWREVAGRLSAGRARPGRGSRGWPRPPRLQARQRDDHQERAGAGHGLRPRARGGARGARTGRARASAAGRHPRAYTSAGRRSRRHDEARWTAVSPGGAPRVGRGAGGVPRSQADQHRRVAGDAGVHGAGAVLGRCR